MERKMTQKEINAYYNERALEGKRKVAFNKTKMQLNTTFRRIMAETKLEKPFVTKSGMVEWGSRK